MANSFWGRLKLEPKASDRNLKLLAPLKPHPMLLIVRVHLRYLHGWKSEIMNSGFWAIGRLPGTYGEGDQIGCEDLRDRLYTKAKIDPRLEKRHWIERPMLVMDLSDASKRLGTRIDGFVGQDILREFAAVRIDYKAGLVEFEK